MGQVIGPGSSSSAASPQARGAFFPVQLIRQYGFRAVLAMLVAASVAFVPLAILIWFNVFRLTSVIATQCGQPVVVKPGRFEQEQSEDEPGETGLLQITCEVPTLDGWRELLCDEDPALRAAGLSNSIYVRDERVYLRKAGHPNVPFGLLGRPPVSAWVPAGDYEIAVVHEAPRDRSLINSPQTGFPFVTMFDSCEVADRQKTVRRIQLPHYSGGQGSPLSVAGQDGETSTPPAPDLQLLKHSIFDAITIPSLGGYIIVMGEPHVAHSADHATCTVDFNSLQTVPREWTRNQLATLRNWLPPDETQARAKLSPLVSALVRREMFEGWFFYAVAGVTGLVFTRWGAMAILEPYRGRDRFLGPAKLCLVIFLISAVGWWLLGR